MAIDLNEPIIEASAARLTADLPTQVTAINAAIAGSPTDFPIEAPYQVLDHPVTLSELVDYPTIAIADGPTKFEDDTGFSATGRHVILVTAYIQDADLRALAWKLRRYEQAIARSLRHPQGAWGWGFEDVRPGPLLIDDADPEDKEGWMSWVELRFWARKDEE